LVLAVGVFAAQLLLIPARPWVGLGVALIAAVLVAWWLRRGPGPRPHPGSRLLEERRVFFLLLLVLFAGGLLRLHRLGDVEGRLCYSRDSTIDEAYKGEWAMEFLHGLRPYTPFIRHWGERETLYIYLESLAIFLFGRSVLTLRAVAFGFGMMALVLLFLLARRLFGNRVALLSTLLLAGSAWHAATNRISERFNMAPAVTCLALWALARALARRRLSDHLLAGICLGIGLYSFPSYRVAPLVVAFGLLDDLVTVPGRRLRRALHALVLGLAALIVVLAPLGFDVGAFQEHFLSPGAHSFKLARHPEDLRRNVVELALAFNVRFRGDMSFHAAGPLLQPLAAAGFLLGLGWLLVGLGDPRRRLLLVWLLVSLLPALVTDAVPRRLGVALPLTYLLAALGIEQLVRCGQALTPGRFLRVVWPVAAAALVLAAGADDARRLLLEAYPAYGHEPCAEYRRAAFLRTVGPYFDVYLTHLGEFQELLRYLTMEDPEQGLDWEARTINPAENLPIHYRAERPVLYSLEDRPVFRESLALFTRIYPHALRITHRTAAGRPLFHSVLIAPEAVNARLGLWGLCWPGGFPVRAEQAADGALVLPAGPRGFATYLGAFYAPGAARLIIRAESPGPLELRIDGIPVLQLRRGRAERRLQLARGLHEARLSAFQTEAQPARIVVRQEGPRTPAFPSSYFHTVSPEIPGLRAVSARTSPIAYRRLSGFTWESPFTDASLKPACIAVTGNGDVLLGDHEHVRIARYDARGRLLSHWDPTRPEQPPAREPLPVGPDRGRPFTMAPSRRNGVWVAVRGRAVLHEFDAAGRLVRTIRGGPEHILDLEETSDGGILACAGSLVWAPPGSERFEPWPLPSTLQEELTSPLAVGELRSTGAIAVYDSAAEAIFLIGPERGAVRVLPNLGRQDAPRLAEDPAGRLIFSGLRMGEPMVFDPAQRLLLSPELDGWDLLEGPRIALMQDLALGPDGTLYLLTFEGEVLRFRPAPITPAARRDHD
jgi:hypothetical protein